jgi:hypothetical protein
MDPAPNRIASHTSPLMRKNRTPASPTLLNHFFRLTFLRPALFRPALFGLSFCTLSFFKLFFLSFL